MHDPLNSHAVEVEGKQCNLIFISDSSKPKSSSSPDMEEKSSGDSPPDGYSHLPDRTVQFIQHYARYMLIIVSITDSRGLFFQIITAMVHDACMRAASSTTVCC
jgi:hypothetical protein